MLEKLLARTERVNDCLEWTGLFNTDGYPRLAPNGKVHRIVFELTNGFKPTVVRHTCDNIRCINPNHLADGTNSDNIRDRHERGRTHMQVFEEELDKVRALRRDGLTHKVIAETLDIKTKRVAYILGRFGG